MNRSLINLTTVLLAAAMISPVASTEPAEGLLMPTHISKARAEGRDLFVLSPRTDTTQVLPTLVDSGDNADKISVRTFETDSQRIYTVSLEDETFTVATSVNGPKTWVAFDPDRRAFAHLLASVRIDLQPGLQLDAIRTELQATRLTVFEPLGFAIVDLPDHLHPIEAVKRVRLLPGSPNAALRLRRPQIQWR